jgi:hypothetical protein
MASSRKAVEDVLVAAMACGASVEQAARKAGISERTAYRRLANPAFKARLKEAKADLLQRTCAVLTAGSLEAVKTLLELQKPSSPPNVRLGAAKAIVELSLRTREAVDFEERLAAIEERVPDKPGNGRPGKGRAA